MIGLGFHAPPLTGSARRLARRNNNNTSWPIYAREGSDEFFTKPFDERTDRV